MKITFTGSHGTGKTTAMNMLYRVLDDNGIETLSSTTRELIDLGWKNEQPGFELACVYLRRQWMLELNGIGCSHVLSERWAMDETAYQMTKVRQRQTSDRNENHILRVCQMEMKWELENYWDIVYYIPVDDRPVEGDGTRPTDKSYQLEIDNAIKDILKPYKKSTKIRTMPTDIELWPDYFSKEVESWETKTK